MTPADSAGQVPPPAPDPAAASAREWVEALVAGRCSEPVFLERILVLEGADAEVGWEVLALLDQQRRRRHLDESVFQRLKRKLQQQCMGYGRELSASANSRTPPPLPPVPSPSMAGRPRLQVDGEGAGLLHGASAPASAPSAAGFAASLADDEDQAELCLQPGDLLKGRYCIVQVQERSDGVLLKALDRVRSDLPSARQCVAIHVLSPECSRQPKVMQRVYRLQSLSHPAIPRLFDVDAAGGRTFFTMDWTDASSLLHIMQREGALAPGLPAVLAILGALASALEHVHAKGFAHGEVTLGNVQVTGRNDLQLQGFVLDERTKVVTTQADCFDFARLAHHLLSKCRAPMLVPAAGFRAQGEGALQRPPGLTTPQWRWMDKALRNGDASAASRLLAALAIPAGSEAQTSATVLPQRHSRWQRSIHWPRLGGQMGAAAALLAVIGLGGNLLLGGGPADEDAKAAGVTAVAVPVPAPMPKAEPAAPAPAPKRPSGTPAPATMPAVVVSPSAFQVTPLLLTSTASKGRTGGLITAGFGSTGAEANASVVTADTVPAGDVLDLPRAVIRVDGSQSVAKIWVRRRGNLHGPVTFFWWTETGSAQTSRDFTQILRRWEVIDDGAAGIELHIPLSADATRTQSRAFYVKIDRAGRGAYLGGRTLAQVEILPARTEAVAANTGLPKQ